MGYRISEVSKMSGVSVRMLRHYDEKGVLSPRVQTGSGYRDYSEGDVERLGKILVLKELGFTISDMKKLLEGEDADYASFIKKHMKALVEKRNRLDRIIEMLEKMAGTDRKGIFKEAESMFKAFDFGEMEKQKKKYAKEVEKKYKGTDAYGQSMGRTEKYGKRDWEDAMKEADVIFKKLAALMAEDRAPDSKEALAAIGEWRAHIDKNYYDCTDIIFGGLADLYDSDPRYAKNMDKYRPGLAKYMSRAIRASIPE